MQANLKAVTAAGIQALRDAQQNAPQQVDAVEVAYAACLLQERDAWGTSQQNNPAQQQQQLTLCSNGSRLPEAAVAAMAGRLAQELLAPTDPAGTATAHLQVAMERSFKQQQDKVEGEQAAHASTAGRLAAAVAYKKVNMQAAGLPLYQSVFEQVVGYVAAVAGLKARVCADPDARAQLGAAVEGVLPLSSLAYFLTLPAQERMQQLESVAAISCGICLFNSHTGSAPSPLSLSAETQMLQAQRLLCDVQAAALQAEAALNHYNRQEQEQEAPGAAAAAAIDSRLAAAAAAYLSIGASSSGGSSSGGGGGDALKQQSAEGGNGSSSVQLGPAVFCCQAAVALRTLAVDLAAGISCCRQLHDEVVSALNQASQVAGDTPGCAVLKEQVFPLFEAAGRMHLALKGELRLLLVRGRLWEAACDALSTAAQQPGVPRVLGFEPKRRLVGSAAGQRAPSGYGGSSMAGGATVVSSVSTSSTVHAGIVFDASSLPPDMEYIPPSPPATAAGSMSDNCWDAPLEHDAFAGIPAAAEQQVLALSGMCPVSLASSVAAGSSASGGGAAEGETSADQETLRLLVGQMARPECGAIRYGGQLYGFATPAALAAFATAPEAVLDAVRQAAHNTPLLLHMLGLASSGGSSGTATSSSAGSGAGGYYYNSSSSPVPQDFAASGDGSSSVAASGAYRGSSRAGSAGRSGQQQGVVSRWRMPPLRGLLELFEAPLKVEASTQTVTHPVEKLVDIHYEWNEWALRRRIIALANLRLKATHSAQTLSSGFRAEGSSQTWLPKDAAVQTKVNKGSSVPRKIRHVTGLRGPPDSKMHVVSLELDVHGRGPASVKKAPGHL